MKITINKSQWEAMGKQAGWMKDIKNIIHPPKTEADFSMTLPYDEKAMGLLIPFDSLLQQVYDVKTKKEKKEKTVALKEIFDVWINCPGCEEYLAKNYTTLLNNQKKSFQELTGKNHSVIKKAISEEQLTPFIRVLESLKGKGKYTFSPEGRMGRSHVDISFYDGAIGEAYIQVYFEERSNMIAVEKYYDNETMNDQYAETKYVPLNVENYAETQQTVNRIIDGWMGSKAKKVEPVAEPMCELCGSNAHHMEECPYYTGSQSVHPVTSRRVKNIILVSETDPLQPTDGVQTSEAANPMREKAKLHCKKCGGPLRMIKQKNPAGLEESVWKCGRGCI